MSELPEVETVRSVLKPRLAGQTVAAVAVRNGSVIARPDANEFAGRIRGASYLRLHAPWKVPHDSL